MVPPRFSAGDFYRQPDFFTICWAYSLHVVGRSLATMIKSFTFFRIVVIISIPMWHRKKQITKDKRFPYTEDDDT